MLFTFYPRSFKVTLWFPRDRVSETFLCGSLHSRVHRGDRKRFPGGLEAIRGAAKDVFVARCVSTRYARARNLQSLYSRQDRHGFPYVYCSRFTLFLLMSTLAVSLANISLS